MKRRWAGKRRGDIGADYTHRKGRRGIPFPEELREFPSFS